MAGFSNTFDDKELVDFLQAGSNQPVFSLLDKALAYYNNRLVALNPNDFKTPEEFMRKWQFYKGALEAVNDLILIMKGK